MVEMKAEGKPRRVVGEHDGGFSVRYELTREDGDFRVRTKANKYVNGKPTQEQMEKLAREESGCEDVEVVLVRLFPEFEETRYNCKRGGGK